MVRSGWKKKQKIDGQKYKSNVRNRRTGKRFGPEKDREINSIYGFAPGESASKPRRSGYVPPLNLSAADYKRRKALNRQVTKGGRPQPQSLASQEDNKSLPMQMQIWNEHLHSEKPSSVAPSQKLHKVKRKKVLKIKPKSLQKLAAVKPRIVYDILPSALCRSEYLNIQKILGGKSNFSSIANAEYKKELREMDKKSMVDHIYFELTGNQSVDRNSQEYRKIQSNFQAALNLFIAEEKQDRAMQEKIRGLAK